MIVLGIETATSVCGVGLACDEGFMADYRILRRNKHAELLPEAIETVLKDAGMRVHEIDGIAVSIGPGSFTGLRIGLGLAKGMAFGLEKPLIAVPTMDGMVSQTPHVCEWACVLLTARKGEVYQGLFRRSENSWQREGKYEIVPENRIGKGLPNEGILFLGEGSDNNKNCILDRVDEAHFLPPFHSIPSGYGVAAKGRELLCEGNVADIDTLSPFYLKRFQGEA
jgi:tRNA threonylcarbamoyladenosine biosynthesis protein TsaB